jgi:hypothetical protein
MASHPPAIGFWIAPTVTTKTLIHPLSDTGPCVNWTSTCFESIELRGKFLLWGLQMLSKLVWAASKTPHGSHAHLSHPRDLLANRKFGTQRAAPGKVRNKTSTHFDVLK